MRHHLSTTALLLLSTLPALASVGGQHRDTEGAAHRLAQAETPLPVPAAPAAPAEPPAGGEDLTAPAPGQPAADGEDGTGDDMSIGEIPVIESIELTLDMSKRALDAYILVKEKYKDSDLDQFENLQDFVDQSADGKAFDADIKAAGFTDVNSWNMAITTLSFAYSSSIDDPSAEILQQIAEIEADTELAQDMKDRMVASLKAMIPSENNKKVVADMLADAGYAEKLKQLDIEEE